MAKRRNRTARPSPTKRRKLNYKKYAGAAAGTALGFIAADIPGAIVGGRLGYGYGNWHLKNKKRPLRKAYKPKYSEISEQFSKPYKQKIMNAWPKGISKKFVKKVEKALEYNDVWGKYIYAANSHLRQYNVDEWGTYFSDENSYQFNFFTPEQFMDAQSVMWNGKAPTVDYRVESGNFNKQTKCHISSSMVEFELVSTSQHCTFVEVYEFRAKSTQTASPPVLINQSYENSDYTNQYRNISGGSNMSIDNIGSTASDWVECYKFFTVKKRTVCLQPGKSSKLRFFGPKDMTYDFSKELVEGDMPDYSKSLKSMNLVFRCKNDITVSGGNANIHNFPHSQHGGIAIRYKRTYVMRPPANATGSNIKNTIWDNFWYKTAEGSTDQLIEVDNPVAIVTDPL